MRLIDADKIDVGCLEAVTMSMAQETIDDVPTEDAKLITHAHWMCDNTGGVRCSNCNCLGRGYDAIWWNSKNEWCSNCGAKMDEEVSYE